MSGFRLALALGLHALALGLGTSFAGTPAEVEATERFEKSVRPLLAEKCWKCHAGEKSKGGLRLDSAEAVAKGGETGLVIDREHPDQSLLLAAVRYNGELKMPPKGKLSDSEIAALAQWVKEGAIWPTTTASADPQPKPEQTTAAVKRPILEAGKSFWAFQPIRDPSPPEVKTAGWARSPIDRFILAPLEAKGFKPAPEAEKRNLIRRATFDLIGLPPTPEEVDAFLKDESPEAFSAVVERLLASPRYGERWGRHWLDLARYADSNGMDENMAHANAYQYRDYVIKAWNADKPYDQFLKEQLAGDLLPKTPDDATNNDRLTATGFLVIGPKMLAEDDPLKMEMDIIDEQVDTVGRVFMGLTLGCARCHDHKFDPIPTADYYSLAAIFKSTKSMANHKVVAMWNEHPLETQAHRDALEKHRAAVTAKKDEITEARDAANEAFVASFTAPPETFAIPRRNRNHDALDKLTRLRDDLAALEKSPPAPAMVMSVEDQAPTNLKIHIRGNHTTLGEEVPRRFLQIIDGDRKPAIPEKQSGRLQLAEWLTDPKHPLTARVMVNRVWLGHFGMGLVRSPDNFGKLGDTPFHAELLDWLASRFIASGWSIKSLHRAIMLSSTYRMSTQDNPEAALADPENRLHWKMPRKRLEAESIRDALLAVSGQLDTTMNGSLLKTPNHNYVNNTGGVGGIDFSVTRRSVYLPVIRSGLYDVFQAFDFADPSASTGLRVPTTVAPQALFMMNDPLVISTSQALADSLRADTTLDDSGRVAKTYLKAFSRPVTEKEASRALEYLKKLGEAYEKEGVPADQRSSRAWQGLCQAVLGSSEFLFID